MDRKGAETWGLEFHIKNTQLKTIKQATPPKKQSSITNQEIHDSPDGLQNIPSPLPTSILDPCQNLLTECLCPASSLVWGLVWGGEPPPPPPQKEVGPAQDGLSRPCANFGGWQDGISRLGIPLACVSCQREDGRANLAWSGRGKVMGGGGSKFAPGPTSLGWGGGNPTPWYCMKSENRSPRCVLHLLGGGVCSSTT